MMKATNDPHVTAIRQSVRTSYNKLQGLLEGPVKELASSRLYKAPAPGEWTIIEILAHIVEFMPYWADELSQVVAQPGKQFGRTAHHAGRLNAIEEHGADSLEQVKSVLLESYAHLDRMLQSLHDSDLEVVGRHITFGDQTVAWFLDEVIVRHLVGHVEQIKRCF